MDQQVKKECCPCPDFRQPGEGCDCYCHEHPETILKWAENAVKTELGSGHTCRRAVAAIRKITKT